MSTPTGRLWVGLRQLAFGAAVFVVAVGLLLGSFSLAATERWVGLPTSAAVAEVTPVPSATLPVVTLPATPLPSSTGEPPQTPETPLPTSLTPTPALYPPCTPSGWRLYQIQAGETIQTLAWQANTSPEVLAEMNCLEAEAFVPGRWVYLPPAFFATATPIPCGAPPDWVLYTVRVGDTLFNLSRRLGITISAIQRANCMASDDHTLYVGKPLYLPAIPPPLTALPTPFPTATPTPTPTPTSVVTPTPTLTATPLPTLVPTPTATGIPSPTPTPTTALTPTVTATPVLTPTETATPTATPSPSSTPEASEAPTATPTPTSTPTPTFTPEP
ncbi:MAG: LysM peptidoglycan-binding domain-containing protein [Anaerolineae bacterium]|nr:LysM peptidoglycan-binding domain-containing protein [Anaerolineae bacterium]